MNNGIGLAEGIRKIVEEISQQQGFSMVDNFYAESQYKKLNLINYFQGIYRLNPDFLFIGEAPGIAGCVQTGIPFTSERVIRKGTISKHFNNITFLTKENIYELSSYFMWQEINKLSKPPLLWNAFPLHPYKFDKHGKKKNRTPGEHELYWGASIFELVIDLFPNLSIISIGNTARDICDELGIKTFGHFTHPANGGVNKFRKQFHKTFLT